MSTLTSLKKLYNKLTGENSKASTNSEAINEITTADIGGGGGSEFYIARIVCNNYSSETINFLIPKFEIKDDDSLITVLQNWLSAVDNGLLNGVSFGSARLSNRVMGIYVPANFYIHETGSTIDNCVIQASLYCADNAGSTPRRIMYSRIGFSNSVHNILDGTYSFVTWNGDTATQDSGFKRLEICDADGSVLWGQAK